MIKFIASDMDGTLLDSNKNFPPDFDYVLDELNRRGIIFAAASGRQYETLRQQFGHFAEKMVIIAENGALACRNGKPVVCDPIPREKALEIADIIENSGEVYPLACGFESAYGEPKNDAVMANVTDYYRKYQHIDSIKNAVMRDKILKFAIFSPAGSDGIHEKIMAADSSLNAVVSGEYWMDIMNDGVSKGSAIRKIQKLYGIKKEECIAFGDYMNDYEMMSECGESYAMENAFPELKKICTHICKSNDEYGVTAAIRELLGI